MDFGIASVAAITVVCYLGGMACKASAKVKDEVIPVVCGVTGGILGVVRHCGWSGGNWGTPGSQTSIQKRVEGGDPDISRRQSG